MIDLCDEICLVFNLIKNGGEYMKKRAIISVSDKTNLIEFAQGLIQCGFEIISTGGTYNVLEAADIQVTAIDEITQFPELLDGRVKTLHPLIHGALLGVRDKQVHLDQMTMHEIYPIDLVCVNLYPFAQTISKLNFTHEEAIENIDIGGPSMIRSAAKNHKFVTVVTDIKDYDMILSEIRAHGDTMLITRQQLAAKAFQLTAAYDAIIQEYFTCYLGETMPKKVIQTYEMKQHLRYGENPHQYASFYTSLKKYRYSISNAVQLHGKELSYNNIQDSEAALQILKEFHGESAVVAVKHMNPCGVGIAKNITLAWNKAYEADPISIFGGIVAFNQEVNVECATAMSQLFLEIVLAPSFEPKALEILSHKKNIRLLTFDLEGEDNLKKCVSVSGGLLIQQEDSTNSVMENLKIVTIKEPTIMQKQDCLFGEKIVKHVKSNAIVIVKDGQTLGIGAGQMNRIGAALIALQQAKDKAKGAILASDAFFPMNDTVELASKYGIACIIHPGGSIKDQDSVDMCNEKGIAMVITGIRHFKH